MFRMVSTCWGTLRSHLTCLDLFYFQTLWDEDCAFSGLLTSTNKGYEGPMHRK